jgi:hypothetical protein
MTLRSYARILGRTAKNWLAFQCWRLRKGKKAAGSWDIFSWRNWWRFEVAVEKSRMRSR